VPLDGIVEAFELPFAGPLVQVKPPLLFVNGHFTPGPTACQFMGSVAW
jgi:hypothetical protein